MIDLVIQEHKSESYGPRTFFNASQATITVAVAASFYTAGEKLTKKAAGDNYVGFSIHEDPVECARQLYTRLKGKMGVIINVAGNGMYTFGSYGFSQKRVNQWIYDLLKPIKQYIGIDKIVNGGQTGADLAGSIAAVALDIPCVSTLPKGFRMRGATGIDARATQEEIRQMIHCGVQALKL